MSTQHALLNTPSCSLMQDTCYNIWRSGASHRCDDGAQRQTRSVSSWHAPPSQQIVNEHLESVLSLEREARVKAEETVSALQAELSALRTREREQSVAAARAQAALDARSELVAFLKDEIAELRAMFKVPAEIDAKPKHLPVHAHATAPANRPSARSRQPYICGPLHHRFNGDPRSFRPGHQETLLVRALIFSP
eukprot:6180824-Pleurochrysis_carterae.AAC.4